MPITNTQEVYEVRSISPVHINPSIMEGTQQLTSILGSDRALEIVRYAPTFLVNVQLTGSNGIPTWLECSAGVVDASPQAFREYRWYANGVLIPGAITNRFLATDIYDGQAIKCIVRAFNLLGEAFNESNEIVVTLIEPIFVQETDVYPITGLGTSDVETVLGISLFSLTGMNVFEAITLSQYSIYPITGMAAFEALSVPHLDTYLLEFYTTIRTFSISNNGAESGSIAGWTIVSGTFASVTSPSKAGTKCFESSSNNVLCKITREIPIVDSGDLAEVAAGNAAARVSYFGTNDVGSGGEDRMRVYIEALDSGGAVVATLPQWDWVTPIVKTGSNLWESFPGIPENIPVTTTSLRIVIEFEPRASVTGNDCQLDEITLQLFKV
jgi:hypothetical protein